MRNRSGSRVAQTAVIVVACLACRSTAHQGGGGQVATVQDLGWCSTHGEATQLARFWAFASGEIAYTLSTPSLPGEALGPVRWSKIGTPGRQRDLDRDCSRVVIDAATRSGALLYHVGLGGEKHDRVYRTAGAARIELSYPEGFEVCWPRVLNYRGDAAGLCLRKEGLATDEWHGCVWVNGKARLIPDIKGEAASPRAINERGDILVGYRVPERHWAYYAIITDGRVQYVETPGWDRVALSAMNNHGDCAGVGARDAATERSRYHLVLLRERHLRDLGRLPVGTMLVRDLDDRGLIVGTAAGSDAGRASQAYMWDETRGLRSLNSLIRKDSKWDLRDAWGIDSNGAIYGAGMLNGQPRFFRLILPHTHR